MQLDATLSAIRQGGSEKRRILHEMLYADLGIKDIRITGSKDEPIISAQEEARIPWKCPPRNPACAGQR